MSDIPNKIMIENAQAGNPASEWDISGGGDPSIQGFTTSMSVNLGETVFFKVNTDAADYRLDIYRLGYYGGEGARKMATITPSVSLPQSQPTPLTDPMTGLIDCGNWAVSASWDVPVDATSGVYIAKLVRQDTGGAGHVVFIVRDDEGHADLLFQTSDTTWQAYNTYGGNSLYVGVPDRAYKVSYNRPFATRGVLPRNFLFWTEYPMIRWLEANGYDVSYFSGVDSDLRGDKILAQKIFLSVGHDEYWSAKQRSNVQAARNAGIHLAFFSGNTVFWKTRWEESIDGSGTSHRTLVCYKETHAGAKIDPTPEWTGTWRDSRFSPPADGGQPENALLGTLFTINDGVVNDALTVPSSHAQMRLWRNTTIATLAEGETATFPVGTLGFEWGEDVDNGFRPAGVVHLSSTTITYDTPQRIVDFGSLYTPGTGTHHLTLYRHRSGALVFDASTIQWAWGLDTHHDGSSAGPPDADPRMQQAMVNLFADMGVQSGTLQVNLTPASASTDSTAPISMIISPTAGATVQTGKPLTITGTAADEDGVVGNVEVSVDGGTTWHLATGGIAWSYIWTPRTLSEVRILSRAVDDSGNLEWPSAGISVTVEQIPGPLGLWNDSITPWTEAFPDSAGEVELGVKFCSDVDGFIRGIRFYKGTKNLGPHTGHLWSNDGTLLAEAAFTEEMPTGWQQVLFTAPVPITANTTYIASYHSSGQYYAINYDFFTSEVVCAPLRAPASSLSDGNGVYRYGPVAFPNLTSWNSNYWVDVIFTTTV